MRVIPCRQSVVLLALAIATIAILHSAAAFADPAPSAAAAKQPEKTAAGPQPGHSAHGEVFDEGPRQKAYLMPGMPKINFPVKTKSAEALAFFNQGVAQLHGFWYFEAERSFRQVAALDPDCAMAYWGMAMANMENEKRAKGFIAKAVERKAAASAHDRLWIDALSGYFAAPDNAGRRRQYVRGLEAVVQDDPKDIEAKAFLAAQIWINGDWMTEASKQVPISSHQAVDALIDEVFAVDPMHPAHHYRIHLWDGEKRERAMQSAALCGQCSPGIAHMWHMPGHIYSGLNRYADAAWQQEASARVDHGHMIHDRVLPDQIHNYAHNNEWLIRDLCMIGRVHDAMDLAKNMLELPRHPKYNTLEKAKGSAHLGRERLIDTLVEYERWGDLVSLANTEYLPPLNTPADKVHRARLLGSALAELGRLDEARNQLATLEGLLKDERADRYKSADDAETKARNEHKNDDETAKLMADALKSHAARIKSLEQAISEIKGRLALATKDIPAAKVEFDKIKNDGGLRREHLPQIYLRLGDKAEAEKLARETFSSAPGEVYPLATFTAVLAEVGKKDDAKKQFAALRKLAGRADLDQPVFERLKPLAKEFGFPEDWRTYEPAKDVGERPDLATLGPFRWQPSPAPGWALPQTDGKPLSLDHYRGKPVLVLFYLGSGCLHCVEQLKTFSPMTSRFAAEGIQIVAISSEPLDSLQQSLTTLKGKEKIEFPLTSDGDRAAFKAYRAYDDFENMPLHGTFLIDGAGRIRWQDIGYEPFMDANFLLEESRRLLKL